MTGARPAIFLDRDGTIIVERGYLADPAGVELAPGAVAGLRRMAALGLPLVVLTNQSGVARGCFTTTEVQQVNRRVDSLFGDEGIAIAGWYVCPHGPEDGCDCRKPLAGLARMAASDHSIDFARSYVIGDKSSDMGVARAVGATGILVETGYGAAAGEAERRLGTMVCADLEAAAAVIERRHGRS